MKYIKKYNEDIDWDWVDEEKSDVFVDFIGHENFYNFLVDNDILDKFINNFNSYKLDICDLKVFLNRYHYDYIGWAFKWKNTPEGYDFWKRLRDEYYFRRSLI